jgi:hypothetical protein
MNANSANGTCRVDPMETYIGYIQLGTTPSGKVSASTRKFEDLQEWVV